MKNQLPRNIFFILILCCSHQANAQDLSAQYVNNTLKIQVKYPNQSMYLSFSFIDEAQLKITGNNLRVKDKRKTKAPFAADFQRNEKELMLLTPKTKLTVDKSTHMISVTRLPGDLLWNGKLEYATHPETEKQIIQIKATGSSNEHYFGLGERLNGFDQKGKRVIMEIDDAWGRSNEEAYKAVPFYMSSRNYGFLVNSSERIIFDMAKENPDQTTIIMPGRETECIIFAGDSPLRIMDQYTNITGKSPVVPDWSLEPWLSRRGHAGWTSTSYAKTELEQMEKNGQYVGVILWEGIRHQFSKKQELSAVDLVNYWHSKGMKVVFWDRTGQLQDTPENLKKYKYDQAAIKKLFLRDKNGDLIRVRPDAKGNPDSPSRVFLYIDPTNPDAMDWWFKNMYEQKVLSDNGISGPAGYNLDGIKIDFSELLPKDLAGYKTHRPIPGIANAHAVNFSEQTFNWLQKVKPEGGITWTRGGGLGLQRGGVFWNGDRVRNLSQLKGTIASLLAASVSGLAYTGHDLGGYMRGNDPEVAETYIRGVQFATFSPFYHDHGSAQGPREQNRYGRDNYGFYSRVRYNLLPYLKGLISDAAQRGWPMMRPLFFYHPEDPQSWLLDDEYFLGQDLLIAPVVSKGTSRVVYLPEGNWIDFWTNEKFEGKTRILINKALNRIPVFVREKTILPLALNENLEIGGEFLHSNKNNLRTTYKLFALESGISTLPAKGGKERSLNIEKSNGKISLKFEGIDRDFAVVIPYLSPASIRVNNKPIPKMQNGFKESREGWNYDSLSSELKIKIKAAKDLFSYTIQLSELPANDIRFKTGTNVAEIPRPNVPEIVSIEGWNESVEIVFDKDDDLDEKYVITYGSLDGGVRQNWADLNHGNKITINGLKNGKSYLFRVWAENQLNRSLETHWQLAVPRGDKKPVHHYSTAGLFIKANRCSKKTVAEDGTKTYSFAVKTDRPVTVKLWVQLNKYVKHHDYNKWYETNLKDLKTIDTVEVVVPANHTLSRIFIAPEGVNPFFKEEF